jgi:hypothetical protein
MRRGEVVQYERPVWEPLVDLVGRDVAGCFMWMNEVELDDGLELHAYKSIATRRYLHLSVDGRAFGYAPRGRYAEISLLEALEEAFTGWEETSPAPRDPDAVRALLARHRGAPEPARHGATFSRASPSRGRVSPASDP